MLEKIKAFAVKHWRVLLVSCITLIALLLIISVIRDQKKMREQNREDAVTVETSGEYSVKTEALEGGKLKVSINGSVSKGGAWLVSSNTYSSFSIDNKDDSNDVLTLVISPKETGVEEIVAQRMESNGNLCAEVRVNISVSENESGTLITNTGSTTVLALVNEKAYGEGTSAPCTVSVSGNTIAVEFTSRLDDIQYQVSEGYESLTLADKSCEYTETQVSDPNNVIYDTNGIAHELSYVIQDVSSTRYVFTAGNDGDFTLSFSSQGIDLEAQRAFIDAYKEGVEKGVDDEGNEYTKELGNDEDREETVANMEMDYNERKAKVERIGAEKLVPFELNLKLHVSEGNIYLTE